MLTFGKLQAKCKELSLTPYYGKGVTKDSLLALLTKHKNKAQENKAQEATAESIVSFVEEEFSLSDIIQEPIKEYPSVVENDKETKAHPLKGESIFGGDFADLVNHLRSLVKSNVKKLCNVDLSINPFLLSHDGVMKAFFTSKGDDNPIMSDNFAISIQEDRLLTISLYYLREFEIHNYSSNVFHIIRVASKKRKLKEKIGEKVRKEELSIQNRYSLIVKKVAIKIEENEDFSTVYEDASLDEEVICIDEECACSFIVTFCFDVVDEEAYKVGGEEYEKGKTRFEARQ